MFGGRLLTGNSPSKVTLWTSRGNSVIQLAQIKKQSEGKLTSCFSKAHSRTSCFHSRKLIVSTVSFEINTLSSSC